MYEVDAAGMSYGRSEVLRPLTCVLKPSKLTVIAGPNGAGKSTVLKLLAREVSPSRGTVRFGGRPLSAFTPGELARRRAVLPQSSQLAFPFTVLEVVRLGTLATGVGARSATGLATDMLERVELGGYAHRYYHQLSGGERQRVHLARVLCQLQSARTPPQNQFLLLDEPTSSLDLKHQIQVLKIAREHCVRGVGVVAVLHDLNLAALFADRLIVLKSGVVAADGPPRKVITSRMVEEVFDVSLEVNQVPRGNTAFVLPHGAA